MCLKRESQGDPHLPEYEMELAPGMHPCFLVDSHGVRKAINHAVMRPRRMERSVWCNATKTQSAVDAAETTTQADNRVEGEGREFNH